VEAREGPQTSIAVFYSSIPYNPTVCNQVCVAFEGI